MNMPKILNLQILRYFFIGVFLAPIIHADEFKAKIKPFLEKYCIECHGAGKKVKGHVNFNTIGNMESAYKKHELWGEIIDLMKDKDMPPEDEKQPTAAEIKMYTDWYTEKFINIKPRPGVARMRRLSTEEYRNSLKSLLGFDLTVNSSATAETRVEKSLVLKVLPQDPPGKSGFSNDTIQTPINSTHWEKYSYLANSAIENLFSAPYRKQLEAYTGPISGKFSVTNAKKIIPKFTAKAFRTLDNKDYVKRALSKIAADYKAKKNLEESTKSELKAILMSPQFLYVGSYNPEKKGPQLVSNDEMAQRLSYFLWGTIPDDELLKLAAQKKLLNKATLMGQVDRMLNDERSKTFTSTFIRQWLSLDEIKKMRGNNPSIMAYFNQPLEFFDYLVREDKPLLEVVDSKTTFVNRNLLSYYDSKDTSKLPKQRAPKGTESPIFPMMKMEMANTPYRGGVLTMPGILAMYSGNKRTSPILRGVWMLERILGDHLGAPPVDVPAIKQPKGGNLSFRQLFEAHRDSPACMLCHIKIDPLGFGMESYDYMGHYRKNSKDVDASGQAPNGDKFDDFAGLKKILLKRYDEDMVNTITKKMFAYAMARKLEAYDNPVINKIAKKMEKGGTYRSLIKEIVLSQSFTQTFVK